MIRADTIHRLHKIAVLRANAAGDFIFALPALDALRSTYPDAEIVLLATDWHRAFLADRPGPVDRVVVVPPSRGVSRAPHEEDDPAALESFFADMHKERFDLAIQLHGGGHFSNPFVRRLHARLTAGLCAADAEPLDLSVPYVYFQSEILRYLEVVGLIGARTDRLEPRIAVTAHDRAEAAVVLPEDGQPIAVLHTGAGDPRRRWPAQNFAQVGDALARAGYRIVLTGAPWERDSARQVQAMMHAEAVDVAGRTSLGAGRASRPGRGGRLQRQRPVASGPRRGHADRWALLVLQSDHSRPAFPRSTSAAHLLAARLSGLRTEHHPRPLRPPRFLRRRDSRRGRHRRGTLTSRQSPDSLSLRETVGVRGAADGPIPGNSPHPNALPKGERPGVDG